MPKRPAMGQQIKHESKRQGRDGEASNGYQVPDLLRLRPYVLGLFLFLVHETGEVRSKRRGDGFLVLELEREPRAVVFVAPFGRQSLKRPGIGRAEAEIFPER